ncbi:unnamed protein product [Schistocephalus solidus]|uniref:BACK domain-containing protein n=1 Tax=Schistocephalus solidus TaxID=70667 RepID=A0A183SCT8_SCHSO|nr:unnamed protein product [Schistocephalus solidus]
MPADTVLTLLRSDDLSVESEEQVIGAISHWVFSGDRADDEKLEVHAPAMLMEVQWHQTTFECRSRLLERYPIFQKSRECLTPCPFNVRPRQTHFFLFGEDKDDWSRWTVLRYDPRQQRAERVADMDARQYATFSFVGGELSDSWAHFPRCVC